MTGRLFWIAVNSVIELISDRVVAGLAFVGALLILCGHVLADLSVVERLRMVQNIGLTGIMLSGVLTTLFAGTNIIDREIRRRQVLCVLSKPIPRNVWLAGKALGLLIVIGGLVFALTTFLFLFIWLETRVWVPDLFLCGFLIYLMLCVLAGYTILFSSITSQFMALFYGILVAVIGHMVDDLRIYWGSHSDAARVLTKALYYVLPDLKSFSVWPVIQGQTQLPGSLIFMLVLYALAYLAISVTIATLIIDRKEFE